MLQFGDVAAAQESGLPVGAPALAAPPLEYESEVSQALGEHERGNFEQARVHFLRAHEVYPNARTFRGLGKVEFELRNYAAAIGYLEAALSSPVRPLPPELREEVQQLLARARADDAEVAPAPEVAPVPPPPASITVPSGPRVEWVERASPLQPTERPATATPVYRKWWVWTIAGAAVAGAVTATALATREPKVHTRPLPSDSPVFANP